MEEHKKEHNECCEHSCGNKSCKKWCCNTKGHLWFRWILGIIILLIVFSIGVSVGKFKSALWGCGNDFGYSMHRGSWYPMMDYGRDGKRFNRNFDSGMMERYWNIPQESTSTPVQ